ncbi:MAG TPA: hypothetical protein VMW10_02145, partial [Alphaproteobacteria bacterium]|nr:hypothetical protein [Alphaproteobacteria bacterium]
AFVGLAQHLGSAMQSAASGAASEAVSGNISLGNVSMGTQAYQNTSAFQHNTSPTYNAAQFKNMGASGIEKNTFADGTQAFNDYGTSNLPVKLMATTNNSFEQQHRLHEAQNVAHSKSAAAGHSMDTALQQTSNVLERLGSDISKHASDNKTLTINEAQALQDHHNFTKDISENLGVSKSRAHELALAVQAGTPKWLGVGVEGSTRFSGSAAHQEQLQQAQSIADQKGYSYSLDTVLSAAHSDMESRNDMKGVELATGASASLNQANHLREEATVAHTRMKEASESFASSQRHDFQETRDVTQSFLEYVAKQPVNSGPNSASSPIGMDQAVAILNAGGSEYETYRDGFKKAHPTYDIQRVNISQAQQSLESQYQAQSNALKADHFPESQYAQNRQSIKRQGQNLGLNQEKFNETPVRQEVKKQHERANDGLDVRKEEFTEQVVPLMHMVNTTREENVVWDNMKQTWSSTSEAAADAYDYLIPNNSPKPPKRKE